MVVEAIGQLRELVLCKDRETMCKHPRFPLKSRRVCLVVKVGNPSCHDLERIVKDLSKGWEWLYAEC